MADFPIYVVEQTPGDLIVFPSRTSYQLLNISQLVTNVAWDIVHTSSVQTYFDYLEPIYNQVGYADIDRVPIIPIHALQRVRDGSIDIGNLHNRRDAELMLQIFRKMILEERLPQAVAIQTADVGDDL
ncbi:Zinc finger, ZZ type [Aspergillus sclerotialis]|uniref:Zinc finger, ZZ type n=1 Tax=Aspergillus sclerotialis TaxID=2070753 RepID=A0A3A2ZFI1_9EURO|nr:Zinc finger, ZZ type [Aspergillus sclerotialis]